MRYHIAVRLLVPALIAGCTEPPASPAGTPPTADIAEATLSARYDSLRIAGDTASAAVTASAIAAVRSAGRVGSLVVTLDGKEQRWNAVVQRTVVPVAVCGPSTPGAPIPTLGGPTTGATPGFAPLPVGCALVHRPVVMAWSADQPVRLITVTAPESLSSATWNGPADAPRAFATLLDAGTRQPQLVAREGSVQIVTVPTAVACTDPTPLPRGVEVTCRTATARVSLALGFAGFLQVPAIFPPPPAGLEPVSRRLSAKEQILPAAVVTVTNAGGLPSPTPPPVPPVGPAALVSRLEAKPSNGRVDFTLTVVNPTSAPVVLSYTSGQKVEFQVLAGPDTVWTWSFDKSFVTALSSDTLAAGATVRYTGDWATPLRGAYVARGYLVNSAGPRVQSLAPVMIP